METMEAVATENRHQAQHAASPQPAGMLEAMEPSLLEQRTG